MRKLEQIKAKEKSGGLFSWFSSGEAHSPRNGSGNLLPSDVFQAHLVQERARADRSGSSFVVMTFGVETHRENTELERQAGNILAECVLNVFRLCDTKGWYEKDGEQVAVIMPDTTAVGTSAPLARTEGLFAKLSRDRIQSRNQQVQTPRLVCSIYNYPTQSGIQREPVKNIDVDMGIQLNAYEIDEVEDLTLEAAYATRGERRV